jgi:hypothetical protein
MWHNSLFVEYVASVASDFDDGDQYFREMKLILLLWAYMGSASLKISRPRGLLCEEKSMVPQKVNVRNKI